MTRRSVATLMTALYLPAGPGWRHYAGDPGGARYSPLDRISRSNVHRLRIAWTYHTGDKRDRPQTTMECTPIVVDGVMHVTSPLLKVIALHAATGKAIWTYDPFEGSDDGRPRGVNRGVSYWQEGDDKRILLVAASRLIALNAATGKPVPGCGDGGAVDLRTGLDRDIAGLTYTVSSPGAIYRNLMVLGSTVGEGPSPAAPGHVRAYDVRSGKQAWIFHTIPHPAAPRQTTPLQPAGFHRRRGDEHFSRSPRLRARAVPQGPLRQHFHPAKQAPKERSFCPGSTAEPCGAAALSIQPPAGCTCHPTKSPGS